MRVHYCDHYPVELPGGHRFPMEKYAALRTRLVERGVLEPGELVPAREARLEWILQVHETRYVDGFCQGELSRDELRRIGFPWSPGLVSRCLASVGGTVMASEAALEEGLSGTLAGGTHHAYRDFGSGYCVFNDIAVAATLLLAAGRVRRVLVFDVDVHQGDGTAALFADDERVFTCSLHGERNFPARKMQSDLDVPLADGTGDEEYLEHLHQALEVSLQEARPDVVFLQGGVDVLEQDKLGRLSLSLEGVEARDRALLERFRGLGLPVVLTLGGGYAQPIDATLEGHLGTYRVAKALG